MGDIIRNVKVCGIKGGKRQKCVTVRALFDTGASASVISRDIAARAGGQIIPRADQVESRILDVMAAEITASAADCAKRRRPIIVDDVLADKAGPKAQMILGHDYMQRTRMAIFMSDDPADAGAACRPAPRRRKRKR